MSRRRFTKEFKLAAVRRLEAGESGSALARELEVKREKLDDWQAQVERYGVEGAFPGPGRRPNGGTRVEPGGEAQARVAELERKVGRQAMEDFLSAALRRVEDPRPQFLGLASRVHSTLVDPGAPSYCSLFPSRL